MTRRSAALQLVLALSFCHVALAQPTAGTFVPAGNMTSPRFLHMATLLADGRVLIAGGTRIEAGTFPNFFKDLTSAELYDPSTVLSDGTVLFTGGHDAVRVSSTGYDHIPYAELYDPRTGVFSATGSMITGRELHNATLLNDGRVLITGGDEYWPTGLGGDGGRDPMGSVLASAEIYNPLVVVPALIVTDLQFDRMNVVAGSSYSANVSGSNLTSETFFDVRFTSPGSNESAVALNWQRGLTASHDVAAAIASGRWTINGVRAHEIETDHTGSFFPVSATIIVSP